MKNYILGAVISLTILISPAFALAQSSGLTSDQINAIISLLQSFGADPSVIDNTRIALNVGGVIEGGQSFCHTFNSDLAFGSTGPEVSALDDALSLDSQMELSGTTVFNEETAAAVVQFQFKYGVTQTGYVGSLTRAKLNGLYGCNGQAQSATTIPSTSVQYQSPVLFPNTGIGPQFGYQWNNDMSVGSANVNDTKALQTALTKEGVYNGPITGRFNKETSSAVTAFQEKYDIIPTGSVGSDTRAKLNSLYLR